jgi:acyl carrier protein
MTDTGLSDADVLERLKGLASAALELQPEQVARIQLETPLVEGLQLDSLKQVVLMSGIEESFGFEFTPDDADAAQKLETVGDLVSLVRQRAAGSPAWR